MLTFQFAARATLAIIVALGLGAGSACGQSYPSRPIRILAAEAGGSVDFAARLVAHELTNLTGRQVIVDNRGGSVIIPAEVVARATPDGYTLLLNSNNFWLLPFLQDKVPYDPVRDFSAITAAVMMPLIVVVHPSAVAGSIRELIALAKAKPGQLNYASGISGASNHLAAELFKFMAGVNIVRISYKGAGPALNDTIAGQVQLMFSTSAQSTPHVKSGRLKALAITSAQPSSLFPGLPTVAASGVPGYEIVSTTGIFAPAGTPKAIVDRLNEYTVRALASGEVKEKLLRSSAEAVGGSPEQFASYVKADMARMGEVIKNAGIRGE